jgi:hypothetical protein
MLADSIISLNPLPRIAGSCALLARLLCGLLVVLAALTGCKNLRETPSPEEVRTELLRRLPTGLEDRAGWAQDIQVAFTSQKLEPSRANLCAALAVIEQESGYRAHPTVPNLGAIVLAEIKRRADANHIPGFVVNKALAFRSTDGRSYAQRISAARSELELSQLYEEITGRLPGGKQLLAGFNPIHTGGPMQVQVAFAERNNNDYPYAITGTMRDEVLSRRGGVYFGIKHLLDYPVDYPALLYRFADFNAGHYASRNAAFQRAASIASGTRLVPDGDLLAPDASMRHPGSTEAALRSISSRLELSDDDIRTALQLEREPDFADTELYQRVFAIADGAGTGNPVPRAQLPEIVLKSPKISRRLTTAWFAKRVNARWKRCMARR